MHQLTMAVHDAATSEVIGSTPRRRAACAASTVRARRPVIPA